MAGGSRGLNWSMILGCFFPWRNRIKGRNRVRMVAAATSRMMHRDHGAPKPLERISTP